MEVVPLSQILKIEVCNHTLSYFIEGREKPLTKRGQLGEAVGSLAPNPFVLCTASTLVNMNFVEGVTATDLLLADGSSLTVPPARRPEVFERVCSWLAGQE